jgi:peptidoglycan-associated lipoprotein
MKSVVLLLMGLLLIISGCGVNKEFVGAQIAESEARTDAKLDENKTATAAEIAALHDLAGKLDDKADMALNKAAGFENYQIIWEGTVNFDFDSWEVTDLAASILQEAGQKMEQNRTSLIEVIGHTDRTGGAKYNLTLGQRRAEAARRFLSENFGISLYRMFTLSHGQAKPVALPDEKNASSTNRRVHLVLWGAM